MKSQVVPVILCSLLFVLILGGCAGRSAPEGWEVYGSSLDGKSSPARSIASLEGGERSVLIEGTIADVCRTKGCWMVVRDDRGDEVFVQFFDYGFFVPRNSIGHRCQVLGHTRRSLVAVEDLRHYAHDAGKTQEEIDAIVSPVERVTFVAKSVMIEGLGLEEPYTR